MIILEIPKSFPRQHAWVAEPLNQLRLKRILRMIVPHANSKEIKVLEVGCGKGAISQVLSQICQTAGLDVMREFLNGKKKNGNLDYIVGDINAFPFRKGCFDLIVCASVLEHMLNLDAVVMKVKDMLKPNGVLIAAYPVETWLFKLAWRFLSPREFKLIDQAHPERVENYWTYPNSHKQTYLTIRMALDKHFKLIQRVKLPFKFLPDIVSYYECVELVNQVI